MSRFAAFSLSSAAALLAWPLLLSSAHAQTDDGAHTPPKDPVVGNFTALNINKQVGSPSALDIRLDGGGNAIRIFARGSKTAGTYFHDSGMLYTSGWVTISGTANEDGQIQQPTKDPSMLNIWSDIHGPAIQIRTAIGAGPESYILQGLDRHANYRFSIEQDGGLRWGATTRAAMDTNLYRNAANSLKTDGSFTVAEKLSVGPSAPTSTFHVDGSQSVKRVAVNSNYQASENDYYIGVTDTSAPRTITLPSAIGNSGRVYIVKDESGKAGTRSITLKAQPGEAIDGAAAHTIRTNYGSLRVISSGKAWFVM